MQTVNKGDIEFFLDAPGEIGETLIVKINSGSIAIPKWHSLTSSVVRNSYNVATRWTPPLHSAFEITIQYASQCNSQVQTFPKHHE